MEHAAHELVSRKGEQGLTEMELAGVQHALDSEVLGLKKCLTYAAESGDDQVQRLFTEMADIHHRRIDMMLTLLEGEGDVTKRAKLLLQGQQEGENGHA